MAGRISPVAVTPDSAHLAPVELGARVRGPLPSHAHVVYAKDLAITIVVLLALPYLVHRLITAPHKVLDGGSNVSLP
jgi:ABC-type uncharacterized transport system permease subunit